jgi:hypothetical protein
VNTTHRAKLSGPDVTAWQFNPDAGIPIWVARKFHNISGVRGEWQAIAGTGEIVDARTGDWCVHHELQIFVMSDAEFRAAFEPLGPDQLFESKRLTTNQKTPLDVA